MRSRIFLVLPVCLAVAALFIPGFAPAPVTLIGIPAGVILAVLYGLGLYLARTTTGYWLGGLILGNSRSAVWPFASRHPRADHPVLDSVRGVVGVSGRDHIRSRLDLASDYRKDKERRAVMIRLFRL